MPFLILKFAVKVHSNIIIRKDEMMGKKIGRKDPCPCGSGKKYKKGCGVEQSQTGITGRPGTYCENAGERLHSGTASGAVSTGTVFCGFQSRPDCIQLDTIC
jgi:hypothetical protein